MPKFMSNGIIKTVETPAKLDENGKILTPAVHKTYKEGDIVECTDEQFEFYKKAKLAKTQSQIQAWQDKSRDKSSDQEVADLSKGSPGNVGATTSVTQNSEQSAQVGGSKGDANKPQDQAPAANQTDSTGQTEGTKAAQKDGKKADGSPF